MLLLSRSRFLRNRDRDVHYHIYPKLFYPELYLIEGGYKAFFGKCKVRGIVGAKSKLSKFCFSAGIWLLDFPLRISNLYSVDQCRIRGIGLELACKWGYCPMSLGFKLGLAQYREYEYGLLSSGTLIPFWNSFFCFSGILRTPVLSAYVGRKPLARSEALF